MAFIKLTASNSGRAIIIDSNNIVDIIGLEDKTEIETFKNSKSVYHVKEKAEDILDMIKKNNGTIADLTEKASGYKQQYELAIKEIHELLIREEISDLDIKRLKKSNSNQIEEIEKLHKEISGFDKAPKSKHSFGLNEIIAKRTRQLLFHKLSIENDVSFNKNNELVYAALYLLTGENNIYPEGWNKWLIDKYEESDAIEKLVVAGSFIAAEIDRLNYLENKTNVQKS